MWQFKPGTTPQRQIDNDSKEVYFLVNIAKMIWKKDYPNDLAKVFCPKID